MRPWPRRARRTEAPRCTIAMAAGMIPVPASRVEYPSTFCRYCWPMNIAPISDPKTMIPATAATQNVGRAAMSRSYSGILGPSLADDERDRRRDADDRQADHERRHVRDGREVDGKDQRSDQDGGQDAAEVVDRVGRLVDVRRHESPGHEEGDDRERQRDEEDRPPLEVLEQEARRRAARARRSRRRGPTRERSSASGPAPAPTVP